MKKEDIEFVDYTGQAKEGDHVQVMTYPSPLDGTKTIANVDAHQWFDAKPGSPNGGMKVTQIKSLEACSHEDARAAAVAYAVEHQIPRIYVQRSA